MKKLGGKPHPVGYHRGCRGAPQNGGVRNGGRVPEGGERGRGAQGTLCLLKTLSTGKAARTQRPRIVSGAARRERARSRAETHPSTSCEGAGAPLAAGRSPSAPATPRGANPASRDTSAPPKGAERAAGATCLLRSLPGVVGAGAVGQTRSSFGGREKGLSPFPQRNNRSARQGGPIASGRGAPLPQGHIGGARVPPKPPVRLNSGAYEAKINISGGFGRKAMRMLHLPGAARRRVVAGRGEEAAPLERDIAWKPTGD